MVVSKPNRAERRRRQRAVTHPGRKKKHNSPEVPGQKSKHQPQRLPEMPDPWLVAPNQVPSGIPLIDYNNIISDAQVSTWRSIKGLHFTSLPFLGFREMENLALAIGLPDPEDSRDRLFNMIADILNWAGRFKRRSILGPKSSHSAYPNKLGFYASLRQEFYNSNLGYLERGAHRQPPDKAVAGLKAVASLEVEVLLKVVEACMKARRSFLENHMFARNHPSNMQSTDENADQVASLLSDQMKLSFALDSSEHKTTAGQSDAQEHEEDQASALYTEDNQDQTMDMPEEHEVVGEMSVNSGPAAGPYEKSPEQRFISAVDNWIQLMDKQEQIKKVQIALWTKFYGKPAVDLSTAQQENERDPEN